MAIKIFKVGCALVLLLFIATTAYLFAIFPNQTIKLDQQRLVQVSQGIGFNQMCRQLAAEDIIRRCGPLKWYSKFDNKLRLIKAGSYLVKPGMDHLALMSLLSHGREHQFAITFVEGDRLRDILLKLDNKGNLKQDIGDPTQLGKRLGSEHANIEGLLFPDTYYYAANSSSFAIVERAYQKMQQQLASQWQQRAPDLPFKNAYEALILASIIEKETGLARERDLIASVFINRLHKKMRLQTDPTVIYGLGEQFDGDITRAHLRQKTPYNTYRINGLPPTPIAMPGIEAIKAALNPAQSEFYYFVSKKDQSHYFSKTLQQHNKAVRKYQLGKNSG
jgi:UPF0755 protein